MAVKQLNYFIFAIILYDICIHLANDMYIPCMLTICSHFNITSEKYELSIAFWFLGASTLQIILGLLANKYGKRKVVISGLVIFIFSTIFCPLVTSYNLFLLFRYFQGVSIACLVVGGYSLIHDLFSQKKCIKVLSIVGAMNLISPIAGPLLGSEIVKKTSWDMIFFFLAIISILPLFILHKVLPKNSIQIIKKEPLSLNIYFFIIKEKLFTGHLLVFICMMSFAFVWVTQVPIIIISEMKASPTTYAVFHSFIFISSLSGMLATRYFIEKIDIRKFLFICLLLGSLGAFSLSLYTYDGNSIATITLIFCFITFISSMTLGPLNRLTMESSSAPSVNKMALLSSSVCAAGFLISVISSKISHKTFSTFSNFIFSLMLTAMIIFIYLQRENKNSRVKRSPSNKL